ncbi:DUF6931 family protein [Paraburkholderia humisilvae]|uniref:Uncharacterized protein n=1 Tax=Paraburkholderia humisilvae TaxID=627669 RepID=A0A6J5DA30_9BURK|nr:hypothetical protein [Paraburkholderia humisilvae]CAB3751138.1 hypothetical protein LMG29542_01422 [Paraburkholderia humisilvae]
MTPVLEAARQMRVSVRAQQHLRSEMEPRAAVQALLDADLAADALSLLARLLPRRYAVAWVCQCARQQALDEHDRAGIALAQAWVREPSEPNRADAAAFAKTHRYQTIGAWTAAAAGWTGGNLNPQHTQPTPAPEHLTALAAMAAITYMAALIADQFAARRAGFVRDALGLLGIPTVSTER